MLRHPNRQSEGWSEVEEQPRESYYMQPRRLSLGGRRLG